MNFTKVIIITSRTVPLSEASASSEGTGVPGRSSSWFSSAGVMEAAVSGDDGFAEDEEYEEGLLSNGLPCRQRVLDFILTAKRQRCLQLLGV